MPDTAKIDPFLGQQIGNYVVKKKLGEGGMGAVYLAEHPLIGKRVALKLLHAEYSANQEVVQRFFNEARAVNDIQHPNIVDIVDYGSLPTAPPTVYFIMEFLSGQSLAQLVDSEKQLAVPRALALAKQVADALSASHSHGIIHRDLKPDNIIVNIRAGQADFAKILDFGIAKLTGDHGGSTRTRTGIVMGTPAYMSPEQCEGKGQVDARTDIYALGILLFEMLTGYVPFTGKGYGEVLVQHLTARPPLPRTLRPDIPPDVEAICMKALAKNPADRYADMQEFMVALQDPTAYVRAHGGTQKMLTSAMALLSADPPTNDLFERAASSPGPAISSATMYEQTLAKPRKNAAKWVGAGAVLVAAVAGFAMWSGSKSPAPPASQNLPATATPMPANVQPTATPSLSPTPTSQAAEPAAIPIAPIVPSEKLSDDTQVSSGKSEAAVASTVGGKTGENAKRSKPAVNKERRKKAPSSETKFGDSVTYP